MDMDDSLINPPPAAVNDEALDDKDRASTGKKGRGGRGAMKPGTTKHFVEVTLSLAETKGLARDIIASASSTTNEPLSTTAVAVLTNLAKVRSIIATALEIATAEPMESGIVATMCANEDTSTFKSVWALAATLNPSLGSTVPSVKAKAGLELAKALQATDGSARSALAKAAAVVS